MVFVLIFFRRFSVTRCLKEKGNWKSHNFSFVNFSLYYAIHMSNKVIHSQVLRLWLNRDGGTKQFADLEKAILLVIHSASYN